MFKVKPLPYFKAKPVAEVFRGAAALIPMPPFDTSIPLPAVIVRLPSVVAVMGSENFKASWLEELTSRPLPTANPKLEPTIESGGFVDNEMELFVVVSGAVAVMVS